MFPYPFMPKAAPTGFRYVMITEIDDTVDICLADNAMAVSAMLDATEEKVGRTWVSPLTLTSEADAEEIYRRVKDIPGFDPDKAKYCNRWDLPFETVVDIAIDVIGFGEGQVFVSDERVSPAKGA